MAEPVREQTEDNIAALKARYEALSAETQAALKAWHEAMIEASGLKVDQVLDVKFYGTEPFQPAIVRRVYVRYGGVRIDVAQKTKTGWHKTTREARQWKIDGRVVTV